MRSEEHTSELQSHSDLVCRLLLEKKKPTERSRPAWFRELPTNTSLCKAACLGGTTLHYFGNCPRSFPWGFADYRDLHSFPTRRSSDLDRARALQRLLRHAEHRARVVGASRPRAR